MKSLIVFTSMFLVGLAMRSTDADEKVKQVSTDQLFVKAQRICPVSGKDLLSMGGPVKASVGKTTVFLCCKACFGRPLNAGHWATVQANLAKQVSMDRLLTKAQRICPVTGKDLLSMGGPVRAEVGGATVFLCCKGCFGRSLHKQHSATVQAILVKAQGQCPIFKKPLGNNPVPVVVNQRLVFVCCKPCTKKVEADSARSIAFVDKQLARRFATPRR